MKAFYIGLSVVAGIIALLIGLATLPNIEFKEFKESLFKQGSEIQGIEGYKFGQKISPEHITPENRNYLDGEFIYKVPSHEKSRWKNTFVGVTSKRLQVHTVVQTHLVEGLDCDYYRENIFTPIREKHGNKGVFANWFGDDYEIIQDEKEIKLICGQYPHKNASLVSIRYKDNTITDKFKRIANVIFEWFDEVMYA